MANPENTKNPGKHRADAERMNALMVRGGRLARQLELRGIPLHISATPDAEGQLEVNISMSGEMLIALGELLLDGLQSHIVKEFPGNVAGDEPEPPQIGPVGGFHPDHRPG